MKKLFFSFLMIIAFSVSPAFASDYVEGYDEGYWEGSKEGYEKGFEEGYTEAEEKYDGFDLISAIGGGVIGFGIGEYLNRKHE